VLDVLRLIFGLGIIVFIFGSISAIGAAFGDDILGDTIDWAPDFIRGSAVLFVIAGALFIVAGLCAACLSIGGLIF